MMGDGLDNHGKDYDQPLDSGDVDGDCGQQVSSGGDIYYNETYYSVGEVRVDQV